MTNVNSHFQREAREVRQLDNELLNQRRAQERERQAQLGSERQAAAVVVSSTTQDVTILETSGTSTFTADTRPNETSPGVKSASENPAMSLKECSQTSQVC